MEDRSSLLIEQGPQDEADTPARMESRSPGTLPVGKLDRSQTLRIFVRSSSTAGGPSGTTEAPRPAAWSERWQRSSRRLASQPLPGYGA
jgi:hypothetical protein